MTAWTSPLEAAHVLLPLSDPDFGIARREYMKLRDVDDVLAHSIGAHGTDSTLFFGVPGNAYNGGGSPDLLSAHLAAIGETVERYSAAYAPIDSEAVRHGTAAALETDLDLLTAEDYALFDDSQYEIPGFEYDRWTRETPLWWRQGIDASTNKPVWAPAQLVHMAGRWRQEPSVGYATSNGLACGITFVEAALSGLFEVVERDGFMLTWYNRLSLPQIDTESSLKLKRYLARHFDPTGLRVHLVDMSVFSGIPSVLAVIRSSSATLAPFAVGAAAAGTIERACEKAATEAMYTRTWMKTEQREGRSLHNVDDLAEALVSFEDHIRLYAGTKMVPKADFLTMSDVRRSVHEVPRFDDTDPERLWDSLVHHLTDKGHRVITFDLTSPDILEAGARVIRTVITGLRPLDSSYAARFMGGDRLLNHAHSLGLVSKPFTFDRLNPLPHPFP
ncbi:MAG: YcaO-like family protein [Propionibacteriaceae bacterium]|nr:YcaO-like family protein [Propionibacteriaceae bacterium]